jgi:hypothetical protein
MTDKELIIKWIENITLYEKDYDTLNMLLNTNDKFFVRVMTEIAKGNLYLSDFETLIGGPSYDSKLRENFMLNEKMQEDLNLILSSNDAINGYNEAINKAINENLLVSPNNTDLVEEVMEEDIYNFFKHTPESSLLYRLHKQKLLDQYNSGVIDSGFLNKYIGVPIIPINYNDIVLTEDDKLFALSKGISLSEAKKIKSLSYYYRGRGV